MITRFCIFAFACVPAVAAGGSGEADQAALIKKLQARSRKVVQDGKGVVEVSVNNLRFADADLELLKPFSGLRILDLTYTQITDEGVERIVASHPALEWLELGGTKATAASVQHLAKLKGLRFLRMYGAAVTDETVRALRAHNLLHVWHGAARWKGDRPTSPAEVEQLHLDNTFVTPAGLKEFADFKNVTYLYYHKFEDATLQTLGEMKMLHTFWLMNHGSEWKDRPRSAAEVKTFSVPRFNSFTAAGLKPLEACTNLKHLSLWDFKTTPDALKVVGTLKSPSVPCFRRSYPLLDHSVPTPKAWGRPRGDIMLSRTRHQSRHRVLDCSDFSRHPKWSQPRSPFSRHRQMLVCQPELGRGDFNGFRHMSSQAASGNSQLPQAATIYAPSGLGTPSRPAAPESKRRATAEQIKT